MIRRYQSPVGTIRQSRPSEIMDTGRWWATMRLLTLLRCGRRGGRAQEEHDPHPHCAHSHMSSCSVNARQMKHWPAAARVGSVTDGGRWSTLGWPRSLLFPLPAIARRNLCNHLPPDTLVSPRRTITPTRTNQNAKHTHRFYYMPACTWYSLDLRCRVAPSPISPPIRLLDLRCRMHRNLPCTCAQGQAPHVQKTISHSVV